MLATATAILSRMYSLLQDVTGGPQGALPENGVGQTGTFVTHVVGFHASATVRPTIAQATPKPRRNKVRGMSLRVAKTRRRW